MPLKLCSVLCRQCKSSLSTYATHHGSVYSLLRRSFNSAPSTALLRLELQVSLFSLCLASCLISVSKSVEYTSTIIQLLNLNLDNLWQHMQKISKYSVVTQRIGPLFGLFNTGAALRSAVNAKLCPHILAPAVGTVLRCHVAMVHTLLCVPPEMEEETFLLLSSGDWETASDTSSPRDTPGH